jgi:hypothetical protein
MHVGRNSDHEHVRLDPRRWRRRLVLAPRRAARDGRGGDEQGARASDEGLDGRSTHCQTCRPEIVHALAYANECRHEEGEKWRALCRDRDGDPLEAIVVIEEGLLVVTLF